MAKISTMKALLASVALTVPFAAQAEAEYTLVISSWAPPTHSINADMWPRFTEMVEEATDGRVTTDLKLGLAPPPAQMDLVMDGAADLSIIFHGYQAGRFVTTKLIELPGYPGTAEAASLAYWNAYDTHLSAANEHRGVKVIAMHTHGPAQLHTIDPIESLEDMDGLKLRVPGGVASDVGAALGATGISVPATKVYETLSSNAADGVVMPIDSRAGFKLTEVAPHFYDMPGGFYRGSFAFIMNEDVFADLPQDIQDALEAEVFGAPLSQAIGAIWDAGDAESRALTDATEGNTTTVASDADQAAFAEVAQAVATDVIAEVAATGVDAQAAYDQIMAELSGE